MSTIAAFCFGIIAGMTIMGVFCDWMLAESQSLLDQSRELQEDAVRLLYTPNPASHERE